MSRYSLGTIRKFRTAQFTVIVDAIGEDSPDISFDKTDETRTKLYTGEWIIFCARARVIHDTLGEIASDYLGDCIYESLGAFMDHKECGAQNRRWRNAGEAGRCGSYFHDMVKTVCHEARTVIKGAQAIKVRA
jgi:hypothetical protein